MTNLSDILGALPTLTSKDRQQIKAALTFLDKGDTILDSQDFALTTLIDFVIGKGIERPSPKFLKSSPQYKSFVGKVDAIEVLVQPANRVAFGTYLRIGFGLLYDNLTAMNIAVSSRTLMNHTHRVPACVNKAFPGYGNQLLLPMLQKRGMMKNDRPTS